MKAIYAFVSIIIMVSSSITAVILIMSSPYYDMCMELARQTDGFSSISCVLHAEFNPGTQKVIDYFTIS